MKSTKTMFAAAFIALAMPFMAVADQTEWFVDLNRPDDSGSGTSEATAFKTIKAAVGAASADDIITVLPGVYCDEMAVDAYGYTNRVYLSKKLHLRSKKGAAETFIVGRHDSATEGDGTATAGVGTAAIRCVLGAADSIVEGFTLADGAGHTASSADAYHSWGGGAVSTSGTHIYLVDCVVTNCAGYRGGAVRYVTAVRCRFEKNRGGSGNVARNIVAVNSLLANNGISAGTGYVTDSGTTVFYNCTIVGNATQYGHANARFCNCVEILDDVGGGYFSPSSALMAVTNSVISYRVRNTTKLTADDVSVFNPQRPQFIASALADWRIAKGTDAEGLGDAALLANVSLPAGIDPYFDLAGRSVPKTGAIQAGCFQEVVEPAGGAVVFATRGTLNGTPIPYAGMSVYPTEYPVQWNFKPAIAEGRGVYGYIHNGELQFPLMDDSFAFMPPSDVNMVVTNEAKITSSVYYVDPAGSDDNDGLSSAHPLKTLQKAVDKTPVSSSSGYDSSMTVVIAAAGDYSEGGVYYAGVTNRIYSSNKRIRFKGAGRDVTTIRGRHDPDGPAGDGRGGNAARCAYLVGYLCAIQGFTLADGACSYEGNGTDSTASQQGGAVFGLPHILDCTITNGAAYRGAAVYGTNARAQLHRTRITGCVAGNGITLNTDYYGCLVYGNNGVLRNDDKMRHCTVYAANGTRGAITSGTVATNCVARDCGMINIGSAAANCTGGNVLYGFNGIYGTYAEKSNSTASPQFADAAGGDFRVMTTSPALTVGVFDPDYWKYYTLDVDGRKILFFDGRPLAGGIQDVQQLVAALTADYCTIEPAQPQAVDAGGTVTWTASNFARPPLGFATNGVPVEGTAESFTYVWDGTPQAGTMDLGLSYLFGTNWYVNAETGSDANTGFTAETPKMTLKAAMEAALLAGDVVHLAEGVYAEGIMPAANSTVVSNRVVVTKAITLVGDGDAANTIIEGAASPNPEYTSYDCNLGSGAVRCGYFVGSGATVRNVTFRNGHTYYLASSSTSAACHGGGVFASADVTFEDCSFVSNRACRAGGACGGTFRRCRFDCNWALHKGTHVLAYSTGTGANSYNCIFGKGFGTVTQDIGNMVGCLFESGQYSLDGKTVQSYGIIPRPAYVFANNIVLCGLFRPTTHFYPSNCVYVAELNSAGADYFHPVNCIYTNTAAVNAELDAATRKIKSRTSWLVDAGATKYATKGGDTDFGGGQRVYNGKVDIGPFEYDWRERYAADIGKAVEVTRASPGVVEVEGRVAIPDGASLAVTILGDDVKGVNVRVSGGELAASGGVADETLTEDALYKIAGPADLLFAYSGEGCAVVDGVAKRTGFKVIFY